MPARKVKKKTIDQIMREVRPIDAAIKRAVAQATRKPGMAKRRQAGSGRRGGRRAA